MFLFATRTDVLINAPFNADETSISHMMSSIKVIISGTEEARTAFDSSFDKVFQTCRFGLIVDTILLPSVAGNKEQRYLLIISSTDELRNALSSILLKETDEQNDDNETNTRSDRFLITGCVPSAEERTAIRLLTLQTIHCGICLAKEQRNETGDRHGDRTRQVVDQVISNWNAESKEPTSTVWGDASWAPDEDLIIPPSWDSKGKIYAVIEANSFEQDIIEQSANLMNQDEVPVDNTRDSREQDTPINAQEWLRRHHQWLEKMSRRPSYETGEGDDIAPVNESDAVEHTDYFQRLLSTTNNR